MQTLFSPRYVLRHPILRGVTLLLGGQVLVAAAGLLLGKAIAVWVRPAELGMYNLLLSGLNLAHVILIVPVIQVFKADQARVGAAVAVAQYGRYAGWVYAIGGGLLLVYGYVYGQLLLCTLIGLAGIGQGLYAGSTDYLNLVGRQRFYVGLQVGYALANLVLVGGIIGLGGQASAIGLWGCLALANGGAAVLALSLSVRSYQPQPAAGAARQRTWSAFRAYATPLVSLALWGWVINYGDRYLIQFYLSETAVGQYSMGYGLGAKLVLLVSPFVVHSTRQVYRLRATNAPLSDVWAVQRPYLLSYAAVALLACFGFYLLRRPVGLLVLSPAYEQAFELAPIVALGYLFLTLTHLLDVCWYAYGFTRLILWTTIVGALANVGFNVLLIPAYGLNGAACAALLGFLVQFLTACFLYRRQLHKQPVAFSL